MNRKLEVIAWSVEDATLIEKGGADRIELVVELERGGLTPPINLVREVVNAVDIPVRVMVRDTDSSFVYNKDLMHGHVLYVQALRDIKPEGIVFGSLTKNKQIDFDQLNEIIEAKGNMKLTFHRAFDEIERAEVISQFEKLSKYDVDTILTSGLSDSALEGSRVIKTLIEKNKINILPGKSIDLDNYKKVIENTGANYIHVGYAVRDKDGNIDVNLIEKMKEGMNND